MTSSNRRRFLKLIGATGVSVAVAGCGDTGNGDNGDDGAEDGGMDGEGTENETENGAENETENGAENETEDGAENETEDGAENETEDDAENETEDGEEEGMGDGDANLRVAHLSPDAPNVDVYVDEEPVLEDVAFGTFSEYLALAPGTYGVQITAAGDAETVVFDEDLEVTEGSFTAAALGEVGEENQPFSVEVFEDDLSDPGEEARVRAIHASPDAPNVDITVEESGDALFEDVAFGAAGATTVPAGSYVLEVRAAGEDGEPVATFDVELASGTVYTAAAAGYLDPGAAPADVPFVLLVVTDSEGGM